ncbi:MAG: hypothetical protein N3A01_05980 [Bacteroidales bacterium]|nr:hypothetical protein [Bacteroidales bacterium]
MYIWKYGADLITIWDYSITAFYLIIIILYGLFLKNYKENSLTVKYFLPGILFKISGGIIFSIFYVYYYGEGDTTNYFQSTMVLLQTIKVDILKFLSILLGNLTPENFSVFNNETGYPLYWNDYRAFSVIRFSTFFCIAGLGYYLPSTIVVSMFTFIGQWKLFNLLASRFPEHIKSIAFSFLFVPSVAFWGSGLYKDSYTFMGACLLFYGFYRLIFLRKKIFINIFIIIFSCYILIEIKPYILLAEVSALFVFFIFINLKAFKNKFIRLVILPFSFLITIFLGSYILAYLGEIIGGDFASFEKMAKKIKITQQDLKQEYYGLNSFDIGEFEPTPQGMLSKFPIATITGLYRPFLWDVRKPIVVISALENSLFLLLTIYILFTFLYSLRYHKIKYVLSVLFSDPYIIFGITFSVIFAFFVGLSTANFGALVRYKIPFIPFYLSSLLIIVKNINVLREKEK